MRVLVILCAIFLLSCNGFKKIKEAFKNDTPYEKYKSFLEKPELFETAMARMWIQAGEDALNDSLFIDPPYAETGYFHATNPEAHSYRFSAKAGQQINISIDVHKQHKSTLFMGLFEWHEGKWDQIAHGDSTLFLQHEFKKSKSCLLRIQPELLTNIYYTVKISVIPQLANPVSGASNTSIQSIFGDARDAGKRTHEGIDIFAKRGTPVVAPADGVITRTGSSTLGGKVIWMRDSKRGLNYYFAHLDRQLVNAGKTVKKGDTLGLVGNTGNAKNTPPHLHFGIYQYGAIDPLGYVQVVNNLTEKIQVDTTALGIPHKVAGKTINLRKGPGTNHPVHSQLNHNTYVEVIGESPSWYRVMLPEKQEGYIYKSLVRPISSGTTISVISSVAILSQPDSSGVPLAHLNDTSKVELLADYKGFRHVRTQQNIFGWIGQGLLDSQAR